MSAESTNKKDTAPGVNPVAPWRLASVKPLAGYKLEVVFNDGTNGFVEMYDFIMSDEAGVFEALRDNELFYKVYLELGIATWPGDIDLSPTMMHDEIKKKGKWVL
ncbi:MAG: DUF2442 domain-containing protein [Gammaproteobacteria bacterium]